MACSGKKSDAIYCNFLILNATMKYIKKNLLEFLFVIF